MTDSTTRHVRTAVNELYITEIFILYTIHNYYYRYWVITEGRSAMREDHIHIRVGNYWEVIGNKGMIGLIQVIAGGRSAMREDRTDV